MNMKKIYMFIALTITMFYVNSANADSAAPCDGLTGATFGLCKAAMAENCSVTRDKISCQRSAAIYTQLTGQTPPWLQQVSTCPTTLVPNATSQWYVTNQFANVKAVIMTATFQNRNEDTSLFQFMKFSNSVPPQVWLVPTETSPSEEEPPIIEPPIITFTYTPAETNLSFSENVALYLIVDVSTLNAPNNTLAIRPVDVELGPLSTTLLGLTTVTFSCNQ